MTVTIGRHSSYAPATSGVGDWREQAACRGHDPELWWALPGSRAEARALAICARCPVTGHCADLAGADGGIWGGRQHTRGGSDPIGHTIACAWCGTTTVKRTSNQRYCGDGPCAADADRYRNRVRHRKAVTS